MYQANESGIDTLADSGSDTIAYLDSFYWNRGILNWDERMLHGGQYRIPIEATVYLDSPDGYLAAGGNPDLVKYIEPLPFAAPLLTRNDTAALAELMRAGVVSRDVVKFGPGLTLADLDLSVADATLSVRWGDAGFDVAVPDASFGFTGTSLPTSGSLDQLQDYKLGAGIDAFEFADGTSYTLDQVLQAVQSQIIGTPGDDLLEGGDQGEVIKGLAGNDVLRGGGGDDSIFAGAGDDTIFPGPGYDYVEGGEGDDTYVYELGNGIDGISEIAGSDTVRFGEGIAPANVLVTRDPYGTLYLEVNEPDSRVEIYGASSDGGAIERVQFADGTTWNAADIEARITTAPATAQGDILNLPDGDDVVDGLAGDDQIYGNGGDDIIFGGAGNDSIEGNAGNNLLVGGAGDDALVEGVNAGRNLFIGGEGSEFIVARAAGSIVALNAGDGEDTLDTYNVPITVSLGGASAADITLSADFSGSVRIGFGPSDGVTVTGYQLSSDLWPQGTLQLIGDDVRTYDLNAVVQAFLDAGAPEGWSAAPALDENVLSVSTTEAFGGALAYQYATAGNVDGLSTGQKQAVLASTDFGMAPQSISAPSVENHAPTIAASDGTLLFGATVAASSLFSVLDQDGDTPTQYEFWDSTTGNGHFSVNGIEAGVNVTIPVAAADLANTSFTASSSMGSDLVWVRANDGQAWSDWKSWNVFSSPHATNAVPVVTAPGGQVLIGDSVAAASLFSVSDADNDPIAQYEFWDDLSGGGHFSVGGVAQDNNPIPVSAAQLDSVRYVADTQPGTEQVWVRASDGIGWSAWQAWNMTSALHIPNAAPEVSATANQTVLLNQSVAASALFSATDADSDPIAKYEFWDSTAGNGHFAVNGMEAGVNVTIPVSAADLANTQFIGSASTGTDLVWVRASDGQTWSDWKSWNMNSWPHLGNSAPAVSAADASILTDQAVAAGSLFSVTDVDSDPIAKYEFWDDVNGGGYWRVNGVQQAAAQAIAVSAADLANSDYAGGANGGTERVWVRANDGLEWSAWQPWNMTTALHVPNAAPVVSASDQTVLLGQAADASSLFSVSDADNDLITQYEFWDSSAGNGHFTVDGAEQGVNVSIPVSAAQLAGTKFVGGSASGSDLVWVRANDGQTWSDWKSWNMQSSPHLTNAAPVVSAADNGLLRGEAVSGSSLFSVSDADGDPIASYQLWDDVNGGGYFTVNGVQQAAGQAIDVSNSDLTNTQYVGAANASTEQVWARANDGIAWGPWKNWLMSTEGGMVRGGLGPDTLNGEAGPTVLEGGGGNDTLTDTEGNNLFSGGAGSDQMTGGSGNDVFVGGSGNDTVATGGGSNVVAFNSGGGTDTVYSDAGASNTLSVGGGIGYNDLSLSKNGNDLVLNAGGDDRVVLKDWYAGKDDVQKLQVILDATPAYDPNSNDPLYNRKVETFDFRGIVIQFDQALAQSPGLTSWAVTNALLQFHLSGSDDAALGGDLAYWYGKNGALTGISLQAAQQVIGASGFGSDAQTLRPFSGLQDGFVKLA